jgi:hypothetical protein
MNNSLLTVFCNFCKRLPWLRPEEKTIDTLTAFMQDAEHDMLTVITALQAHIDLLQAEQTSNQCSVTRFAVLNRSIERIISDLNVLSVISELVQAPRSTNRQSVQGLMLEIAAETQAAFELSNVTLSCTIATGTTLIGNAPALKIMITGMVLAVLHKCKKFETVRIVGLADKKSVSLSFDTGSTAGKGDFQPWQLGELRLIPTNGEGISLAAVEAMARLHHGHLSVSSISNDRRGYKLIFNV